MWNSQSTDVSLLPLKPSLIHLPANESTTSLLTIDQKVSICWVNNKVFESTCKKLLNLRFRHLNKNYRYCYKYLFITVFQGQAVPIVTSLYTLHSNHIGLIKSFLIKDLSLPRITLNQIYHITPRITTLVFQTFTNLPIFLGFQVDGRLLVFPHPLTHISSWFLASYVWPTTLLLNLSLYRLYVCECGYPNWSAVILMKSPPHKHTHTHTQCRGETRHA